MGTRFVATREARAHPAYKAALAATGPADTVVVKRSLGTPGRVLDGPQARRILAAEAAGAPKEELLRLVSGEANALATDGGDLDAGYAWAGQCAGLIQSVEPAGEVVRRMAAEAVEEMRRLRRLFAEQQGRA
jgi:enoyl-[acyl-carrier protein] reductase II